MAFVSAIAITTYGSRRVRRTVYDTEREDTFVRCMLQADALPAGYELPTIGALIVGMDNDVIVDTGSTIHVLDGSNTYTMGQDLKWHETGGAAG